MGAIPVLRQHHSLHALAAELVLHRFGEILPVAARVQSRAEQVGQACQQIGTDLLLLFKRHIAQFQDKRRVEIKILLAD